MIVKSDFEDNNPIEDEICTPDRIQDIKKILLDIYHEHR